MSCDCDIRTAIERLEEARLIEPLNPLESMLLFDVDKADKDSFLFLDHLQMEEDYIFQFLPSKDRTDLLLEHTIIRNFKRRGMPIPDTFFEQHKAREKGLFFRVGR